jgi:hypothetical protein
VGAAADAGGLAVNRDAGVVEVGDDGLVRTLPDDDEIDDAPKVQATTLSPTETRGFQTWKATLPARLQSEEDYDLKGFYRKNPTWSPDDPEAHMTDEFKLPNHPTFSNESKYYNPQTAPYGGHWMGDVYVPNDGSRKKLQDETQGADPNDPPPTFLVKKNGAQAVAPVEDRPRLAQEANAVMMDRAADPLARAKARDYLAGLASYANENKAGPLTDAQQTADYRLSRDPLAEGDANMSDPRWQRLTGNTPADAAERDQREGAREFIKFAGMGAAGELATPLVARGVGGARSIMAPRPVVVRDPAALAPVEAGPAVRFPRRGDFYVPRDGDMGPGLFKGAETSSSLAPTQVLKPPPRMSVVAPEIGRLNAEGAKGGAVAEAAKLDSASAGIHPTIASNERGLFHSGPSPISDGSAREGISMALNPKDSIQYIYNHGKATEGHITKFKLDPNASIAGIEEAKEAAKKLGIRDHDFFEHDYFDNWRIRKYLADEGWDGAEFEDQGPAHTGNEMHTTVRVFKPEVLKTEKAARVVDGKIVNGVPTHGPVDPAVAARDANEVLLSHLSSPAQKDAARDYLVSLGNR